MEDFEERGPLLHECMSEFAHASFVVRKESYIRRASQIRSFVSMVSVRPSDIPVKRHMAKATDNSVVSGFGTY